MELLRSLGWSPKTVLDVGGYKGHWTRAHQRIFPRAAFTVIEPNPHSELQSLNARVVSEIVSAEPGTVSWYSNLSTGDSLYKEKTRHYSSVAPTVRTTTTLDALFPTETFDFVKLDCQGAELDILKGGIKLIEGTEVLLLECSFAGEYNQGAPKFVDYMTTLDSFGFAPLDITELHHANGVLCQIDVLFLRKTSPYWESIQARMIR